MKFVPLPEVEYLRACFEFNSDGLLVWRRRPREHFSRDIDWRRWCTKHAGAIAGADCGEDYRRLTLNGRSLPAHRVAYCVFHGVDPREQEVDHIDGDRQNNRIENLRLASRVQNACNSRLLARNTSGIKGVRWDTRRSRWLASVIFKGVRHFKSFLAKHDAVEWARQKRESLHQEFARFK